MDTRNVVAKSQAKILGKSEATWEIAGWTGPLSDFMLSEAECFVNIPTANIQLRFHLAPYKSHLEANLKFCSTLKKLYHRSRGCCGTCVPGWLTVPSSNYPEEVLPKNTPRSAGYSLLVDVLSAPTEKLALKIHVDKLNGDNFHGPNNNLVILNTNSKRKNIPVLGNFWRTVMWNVDESGNVVNFEQTMLDTVDNAKIRLTVAAYQMETTGTDAPIAMKMASEKSIPTTKECTAYNPTAPWVQYDNNLPKPPQFEEEFTPDLNHLQQQEQQMQQMMSQLRVRQLAAGYGPTPETSGIGVPVNTGTEYASNNPSQWPASWQTHIAPSFPLRSGYWQATPTTAETQQRPDGQTNNPNGNKWKSLNPKRAINPGNATTVSQTDANVQPPRSTKPLEIRLADEFAATLQDNVQPSASLDAGSDFELIPSADKQKLMVLQAEIIEEARKMEEDLKELWNTCSLLMQTELRI